MNSILRPVLRVFPLVLGLIAFAVFPGAPQIQGAPAIVRSLPADTALDVPPGTPVVITFSAPMNQSATVAKFVDLLNPLVLLETVASWNPDGTELTCTPVPPFPSERPIAWNVQGKDLAGASLTGTREGFFMTGAGGPAILSVSPASLSTDVPPDAVVAFRFSAAMNPQATTVQFQDADAPHASFPVRSVWSADRFELACTPEPLFPKGRKILWTAAGEDATGKPLTVQNGSFTTISELPSIISVTPANNAEDVATNDAVVFIFNVPMNPSVTSVEFRDSADPLFLLPAGTNWNAALTQLTCTPAPGFPTDRTIQWSVRGEDSSGNALPLSTGRFVTADRVEPPVFPASFALISRGEAVEQLEAELFQSASMEFLALASEILSDGVTIAPPAPGLAMVLQSSGSSDVLKARDELSPASRFATKYPPGDYIFTAFATNGAAAAVAPLLDGPLPPIARVQNWQMTPHAVLGQSCTLAWDYHSNDSAVDYLLLQIEQGGEIVFSTPLPGTQGALTGTSNAVVVPPGAFTKSGRAEVRLTAFSITSTDDRSIAEITVRSARHRTTAFSLRIVNGEAPPPVLKTTSITEVSIGEPFLFPLSTAGGVRPIRYEMIGGELPPGLALEEGAISGQPSSVGSYAASLRLTDLLGRSSTETLAVATVPAIPQAGPRLKNPRIVPGPQLAVDLTAGPDESCALEESRNLAQWTQVLVTNVANGFITLRLPADGNAAFFRVRGSGAGLPPPNPLTVAPVLNPALKATGSFDVSGGTLILTNLAGYVFALSIPPGALERTEVITMTDVPEIGGLPLSGGLRAAVDLQPEGLMFDLPARLGITLPPGVEVGSQMGFGARPDGSQFALQPTISTESTVYLDLWHFSLAGTGSGTAGDAQAQAQNAPEDAMTAFDQQVAAELAACKADPNCEPASAQQELTRLFILMADAVVLPALQEAVGDEAQIDGAFEVWLRWLKRMSMLDLTDDAAVAATTKSRDLQQRINKAHSLAAQAIKNGITKTCQDCLDHKIWRIYRMMRLVKKAIFALDVDYTETWRACAKRCLVFELSIESEIVLAEGGTIYTTHTKGKAKLYPHSFGGEGGDDITQLMLIFEGAGEWPITSLQQTVPEKCSMTKSPKDGKLDVLWAKIHLYKERQTWIPGEGAVTTYEFDPDMTLKLRSGLPPMPKEGRTVICPKAPPAKVIDMFGPKFNVLHNDEAMVDEAVGAPVFRMTGFTPGGPDDVILSKPYFKSQSSITENTLIELRHTPK